MEGLKWLGARVFGDVTQRKGAAKGGKLWKTGD